MKSKELIKQIGFSTDNFYEVTEVKITLTEKLIERIKSVVELVKTNNLISAKIDAGEVELLNDGEATDFRDDGIEFIVFGSGTVYVYFQSSFTSHSQYESEAIEPHELVI